MNQQVPLFDDTIMTVPEMARYLKISRAKAYYWVKMNKIPHFKIGRNVRLRKSDLLTWLEQRIEKAN